jgi:hypothetical protein
MFVINAQAQRIVTVVNAVPRNLAVVIKQIGEGKTDAPAEQKAEAKVEQVEAAPQETAQPLKQKLRRVPSKKRQPKHNRKIKLGNFSSRTQGKTSEAIMLGRFFRLGALE